MSRVVDPMCGSGTFVIEAADIAAGLNPGRTRHFAFEKLATFDAAAWEAMKAAAPSRVPAGMFFGSDRDAGAIRMAKQNAERAGVSAFTRFAQQSVSDLVPPEGPPGLVIVNPPYGTRIGDKKPLFALYGALGQVLKARFSGWRVGLVTTRQVAGAGNGTAVPRSRAAGAAWRAEGDALPDGGAGLSYDQLAAKAPTAIRMMMQVMTQCLAVN